MISRAHGNPVDRDIRSLVSESELQDNPTQSQYHQ